MIILNGIPHWTEGTLFSFLLNTKARAKHRADHAAIKPPDAKIRIGALENRCSANEERI